MAKEINIVAGPLLMSALAAHPTWADEQHPAMLGDVVVTARRTVERLQSVPVAVTVLSAKQLTARGLTKIEDLNNAVPGLSVIGINTPTTLDFTIRGLGNTDPNTGSDAAVGFYINEVPIELQNGTNLGFFDMDSVQVLKGPQGTLFGRNTTGGAVLVSTKKPVDYFEGYLQGGGTFFQIGHGVQGEGMVNVPVNDRLALRFAFSGQDQDGWIRNVIPRNAGPAVFNPVPFPAGVTDFTNRGGVKSFDWRISAKLKLSDNLEDLFVYSGGHEDTTALAPNTTALNPNGAIVTFAPFLGFPDPTAAWNQLQTIKSHYFWSTETPFNTPLTLTTTNISNTLTWSVGDLTLKNIAGYRRTHENYVEDIVGLPGVYLAYRGDAGGDEFSDEMQMQGKLGDGRVNWVGGLFFFNEKRHFDVSHQIDFDSPGNSFGYTSRSRSYSVFGQATAKLPWVEGLSLTLGGRFTWDRRRATDIVVLPLPSGDVCVFPGVTLANCLLHGSANFSSPSYNASLDYKWDRDSLVYLSTSYGYRSGGFSDTPGDAQSFLPFNPEHVTNYEIGLKKDWRFGDSALRTNVALYHARYNNIQRLVVDPTDIEVQIIQNAGRAVVDGGEVELTFVPVSGLEISYSYAWTDPVYKQFIANGQNYAGFTFANAPHHTHNLSVAYKLPVNEAYGSVSLQATYHHESKHFYDDEQQTTVSGPVETLRSPGYGLVNLTASWNSVMQSPVDVELFVRNLTNAKVVPNGAPLFFALGNGTTFFGVPPMMAGFNVRYHFGRR